MTASPTFTQDKQTFLTLIQITQAAKQELSMFSREITHTTCPNRDDLIIILHHTALIARDLGIFLRAFAPNLKQPAFVDEFRTFLQEYLAENDIIPPILAPYFAFMSIHNQIYEQNLTCSRFYDDVSDFMIWYGYLGSTLSGQSSIASKYHLTLRYMVDEQLYPMLYELASSLADTFDAQLLQGLDFVRERAIFLIHTPEDQLSSGDIMWWCQRFDTTHEEYQSHKVESLIQEVPMQAVSEILERLQQIATNDNVRAELRTLAQEKLRLLSKM